MFGLDLSEDEQAQLIKDWLRRYLPYVAGGLVAIFIAIGGYSYYGSNQQKNYRAATELLFELTEHSNAVVENQQQDARSRAEAISTAKGLVDQLATIAGESYQASMGRIQYARVLLANQSDYASMEEALGGETISENPLIAGIATLLLANAAWLNEDLEGALALLGQDIHPGLRPLAYQLSGDIHLFRGDKEQAASAYAKANEAGIHSELLRLKTLTVSSDASDSQTTGSDQ